MANPSVATIVKQALEPVALRIKNDPSDLSVVPDAAENATYIALTGQPNSQGLEVGKRDSLKRILSDMNNVLSEKEINDDTPFIDDEAWAVRHMQWTLLRFARVHGINAIPSPDVSGTDRTDYADETEMHVGSAKASFGHFSLIGKFGKKARPESEDDLAKQILNNFLRAMETIQKAIANGLTDANNIFRNQKEREDWDKMGQNYQYVAKRIELGDKPPKSVLNETEFGNVEATVSFLLDLADRVRRSRTYREPTSSS